MDKKDLLNEHEKYCENYNSADVKMPEKDSYLNFQNYKKMFPVPFVIYADFESFTQKIPFTQPNPKYFYTFNYQKHKPSGYCIYVKSNILNLKFKPFVYSKNSEDDDVASNFVK